MTPNDPLRDKNAPIDLRQPIDHPTPPVSHPNTVSEGSGGAIASGTVLNNTYRVEKRIGVGGMGEVYLATHLALGRQVAVKIVHASVPDGDVLIQRFLREARLLSQFNHPNIVTVLDFGVTEPHPTYFLVLEYLQGETLQDYVARRRPVPLGTVLEVMREVCAGVGAAHQHQVVHRDLKPANVFLVPRAGRGPAVKILDFGLAKPMERAGENPLTVAGTVVGTCGYTAPEQLQGKDADVRSDVYSLGGILYYLTAGVPPYHGQTIHSIIVKQATEPPPSIDFARLGIPEAAGLRVVLNKALSRDPEQRYQTTAELVAAMETVLAPLVPANIDSNFLFSSGTMAAFPPDVPQQTSLDPALQPVAPVPPRRGGLVPLLVGMLLGMVVLAAAVGVAVWQPWKSDANRRDDTQAVVPPDRANRSGMVHPPAGRAVPGVTETEVVFGMCGPFSGPAKELGRSMALGIETAFSRLNADGGIHGRKLRLLSADDGYEPERAKTRVRTLLDQDQVFGFVGNVGTPTTAAALPLIVESNRVLFGAYTGAGVVRNDPPDRYVFNYRPSYAEETAAIVGHLTTSRKIRPDRIAVFAQEDSYGDAGFAGVAKALRKHGIDPATILRVGYTRNKGDVAEAAATLVKNKERVAAVVMVATYQPAAKLIKAVRDAGLTPVFSNVSFVGATALAELLAGYGPTFADGVIVTQVVPDVRSGASGVRRFRDDLRKYHPSEAPDSVSLEGYIAAEILAEGVRRAGPGLNPDTLVEALELITDLDLGIGAIVSYGPSRHQASHKVWGTVLTGTGEYQPLDLE